MGSGIRDRSKSEYGTAFSFSAYGTVRRVERDEQRSSRSFREYRSRTQKPLRLIAGSFYPGGLVFEEKELALKHSQHLHAAREAV